MRNLLTAAVVMIIGTCLPARADPPGTCTCCTSVGIGDIAYFRYDHIGENGIVMKCRLNYGTSVSDSLALYVADSPAGPARKVWTIKPLQSAPPLEGTIVDLSHSVWPYADCYYYWLDHGSGHFPAVRSTRYQTLSPTRTIRFVMGGILDRCLTRRILVMSSTHN